MTGSVSNSPSNRPKWRLLLLPLSLVYWLIIKFRNTCYDRGWFRVKSTGRPTIAVGNITTGGTGKTPLVEAIVRHILSSQKQPAILTRGYKSESEKAGAVLLHPNSDTDAASNYGDEVAMLSTKLPGVPIGIGAERLRSAARVLNEKEIDCFVLDDAFQHQRVKRDVNVVVIDATDPFGGGFLLPVGNLREPRSSLRRADVIVLTRCEQVHSEELRTIEEKVASFSSAPLVRSSIKTQGIRNLDSGDCSDSTPSAGSMVWLLAAIANPAGFRETVAGLGYQIAGQSFFADHHRYRDGEIEQVVERASKSGAAAIITTAKDAVKLSSAQSGGPPCLVLEIGIDFGASADIFWGIIEEVL